MGARTTNIIANFVEETIISVIKCAVSAVVEFSVFVGRKHPLSKRTPLRDKQLSRTDMREELRKCVLV